MRALSGQPAAVQALGERSTRMRVQIDRSGAGAWVDLSSYEGRDWIESVEYDDNADQPVNEATIRLRRKWHDLSLSPLVAQSKLNAGGVLVFPKRKVKIEVAVMPRGAAAGVSDWMEVFRGRIDKIDWQKSPIEVRCRDMGGDLQDGWVELQAVYGTGAGRAIELVIQDLLDDAFDNGWIPEEVTLYSKNGTGGTPFAPADSPGFLILEYKQGREPLMDAVQKLARLIGWECRYRWNADASAFQLTLYEPVRPVRSRGTITVSGNPTAAETFTIDTETYTARAAGAVTDEFNIVAGNTAATAQNIADMLNAGSGKAKLNAWRNGSTVIVEWQEPGAAGDAVTFTESMSNVTMDGGGTLGGTRAGIDRTPDHTFGPDDYWDVQQLTIDVKDVRNAFSGTFEDEDGNRTTVERRNDDSIAKYNRRPFILTEAASSQIDTVEEMVDLLDAADNDLSEPDAVQAIEAPYFPWGEPGDFYRFEANGEHYDSDQDLAAVSLRHTLSTDRSRTLITARGKPSLGPTRWLEAEGRPGVGPPPDIYSDAAPNSPAAKAGLGMIVVTCDDPRTMEPPIEDWLVTKCYVDTTNGFTPGPSNLVAIGRQTRFEVAGLTPGTTYYAKLQHLDGRGNVSATSTQVSVAAQRVGPYHENSDSQAFDQLVRNGDFNIWTLGDDSMPDFWSVTVGEYSSSGRVYFTTDAKTGARAMLLRSSGAGLIAAIRSKRIPLPAEELVRIGITTKVDAANAIVRLRARWLDSSFSLLSTDETAFSGFSSTTFQELSSAVFEAPASTRYLEVEIHVTVSGHPRTLTLDRVGCVREYAAAHRLVSGPQAIGNSGALRVVDFTDVQAEELGIDYASGEYTIVHPGSYIWEAGLTFEADESEIEKMVIQVDSGSGYTTVATAPPVASANWSNVSRALARTGVLDLAAGDKVRVAVEPSINGLFINDFDSPFENFVSGRLYVRPTR